MVGYYRGTIERSFRVSTHLYTLYEKILYIFKFRNSLTICPPTVSQFCKCQKCKNAVFMLSVYVKKSHVGPAIYCINSHTEIVLALNNDYTWLH